MIDRIKLIVGLGNPGLSYRHTRHNAGAQAVERLAKKHRLIFRPNRSFKSLVVSGKIEDINVCLALPQTFMNLSGVAVSALLRKKHIALRDILVVCDDVALPLGEIRLKASGSYGGHNGLASVIERLGTKDFSRLRLGVGSGPGDKDLADYVLSGFQKSERTALNGMLDTAVEAIEVWASKGIDKCMNHFNKKQ